MSAEIAPRALSIPTGVLDRLQVPGEPGIAATPGAGPPRAGGGDQVAARDQRDLDTLMLTYPLGSRLRFLTYQPVMAPRHWRRVAEQASWGFRPGDSLEVTGHGATCNFPEALLVRRLSDGVQAMIFPLEVEPPARQNQA